MGSGRGRAALSRLRVPTSWVQDAGGVLFALRSVNEVSVRSGNVGRLCTIRRGYGGRERREVRRKPGYARGEAVRVRAGSAWPAHWRRTCGAKRPKARSGVLSRVGRIKWCVSERVRPGQGDAQSASVLCEGLGLATFFPCERPRSPSEHTPRFKRTSGQRPAQPINERETSSPLCRSCLCRYLFF